MEDKNTNKIYISQDEEVSSIVEKIKQFKGDDIVLVISKDALILQNVINLKILKRKAEEENKNISIIKDNFTKEDRSNFNKIADIDNKNAKNTNSIKTAEELRKVHNNAKDNKSEESAIFVKQNRISKTKQENKIRMSDIIKRVDQEEAVNNSEKKVDIIEEKNDFEESGHYSQQNLQQEKINGEEGNISQINSDANSKLTKKVRRKKITLISSINSKLFTIFFFISIVAIFVAFSFILPKADIEIVLNAEPITYDFEFVAEEFLNQVDVINNKVPLEKIEISSEEKREYPTTGKKHLQKKASGEITIFNEYSSYPQRIVATTRFLSKDSNKLFRVKNSVTIPGFSRVEGVDVPGQVTVTIYADKPGEEYNIDPTSFYLPGLQGSAKYTAIYARSTKAMSGGIDKEVSYFSQSDYIIARDELLKLVKEKNNKDLSSKLSEQSLVLKDVKKEEKNVKVITDIEVGEVADNFEINVIAKTDKFLISKKDLNKIIDEKIKSKIGIDRELLDGSRSYSIEKTEIDNGSKVTIFVRVKQGIVTKIDIEKLKKEIANKSEIELINYFSNIKEISETNVSFWPFWVKRSPSSYDKINITIDINNSI